MGILAVLTVLFSVQAARTWFGPFQVDLAVETDAETQKAVLPPLVKQRKPPKSAYDAIAAIEPSISADEAKLPDVLNSSAEIAIITHKPAKIISGE